MGQSDPVFGLYRQKWINLNQNIGNTLAMLTNTAYNPNWPNTPASAYTAIFTNFETEINSGMNYYGQRVRGFVVPPLNGNYVFWIASDDASELFVSTDETPANRVPTAWVNGWTDARQWTVESNQQSAPIPLQAGRRYYVEAIMQQGNGGDNLTVRWQLPNLLFEEPMTAVSPNGTVIIPFDGTTASPGIYQHTPNLTVVEGQDAPLSVLVTNHGPVTYQWLLQGAKLAGANALQPAYTVANVSIAANNGQVYACVVSNAAGAVTSPPIALTVISDTVPPNVVRAINSGMTNAQIFYSKPVELATGANPANYVFTNGLPVLSATLSTNNELVTLTTAPLVYGSNYTVVINGVRDRASLPNTIAANTTVSFTALPFAPVSIGNPTGAVGLVMAGNGVNATSSGSDVGGIADQFGFSYQMVTGDFDRAARVPGLGLSDAWAKAGLMARETLDPGSRFAAALTTASIAGSFFCMRDPANSLAINSGSFPPNTPNTWLRLRRVGNAFTAYAGYDGAAWALLGSATIALPNTVFFGLAVSSRNAALSTTAEFRDLIPVTNGLSLTQLSPNEPLGVCSRRTPIVISEIMYKPAPRADTNNLEFVEVYNTNPWFQDISGYQIVSGSMSYRFPAGTVLPGGGFLVVAASPQSLQTVYGIANAMGPWSGSLKKADALQLLDARGAGLLNIPYSNAYPWPVSADGTGHSIVLAKPTYGEADPRAWDISDLAGGSPGGPEAFHPSPLRNVFLNELLAHSESPAAPQFVELYNHSNQTNDVSGCVLTDDPATNKCVLPPGSLIPPRGFLSVDQTQLGFSLNGAGATIYFRNPDGSRILDAVQYEAQADGVSLGRWPDGGRDFYPLTASTPGTNNSQVLVGDMVINELMYDPISGNDDDQYIELYNRGSNTLSLAGWQFASGVSFIFPNTATLAPGGYLVIARNATNLMAKYPNLNSANTLGNFGGKLSHHGERVALAMPQSLTVNGASGPATNQIFVVEDEVTYDVGGRWGQWAHGGGSSLELRDPHSNHRLAYNWGDSDETMKSAWTNLEFTGILDNGANYGSAIDYVQLGLLDIGECLVDNIEVRPGGTNGANIISNGGFESGLTGWMLQGDHMRSSLETASGLGGYQSSQCLHLRSSDGVWTLADSAQGALSQTTLGQGQTATLRLKARWLRGWPEVLLRLRGNWLEVTGRMPVPANLGTPGLPNSRLAPSAGPAIYEVKHAPPLPAANQPVVVTARFHDFNGIQPTLLYRIDTGVNAKPNYVRVPMGDNGSGGDAVAGDGLFSATIPAQSAGTVVAFLVQARDNLGVTNLFPTDLRNNAGAPRECVVAFGDPIPTGSFSHHHLFLTQNWAQRWASVGGVSHEVHDGTWIDGGGRIIYDCAARYAGSPYHQNLGSPVTAIGGMHWIVPDDDLLFGVTSLNKQHVPGNNPLDDNTLQREQACFWMAQQIGLPAQNRRYYVYYVNGNRHGPLMEDAQTPDGEMLKEYWPNDSGGVLYKHHSWFEGDVAQQSDGYMDFVNESFSVLGKFTTTVNGAANQFKLARYRWDWWIRQYPESANDYSALYALINAANLPTGNAAYYAQMEALVDTEEWLRYSAMEHATGDWDSFFTENQWNMYDYKPTLGKWTALKWDWNISLGSSGSWGPDGGQLFAAGSADPVMSTFQNYPPYRRAYLRGLQDVAQLAMNNAAVNPVLDAKYAAFVENGLANNSYNGLMVVEPGAAGLKNWIGAMNSSLLAAIASQGVNNVGFAVRSISVNNNVATITGTAPIGVKTLFFNGTPWPVAWPSVTGWTATVPLPPGANTISITGTDARGQPLPGASATTTAMVPGTQPSPQGQVAINEIMFNPSAANTSYLELYNPSATNTFDLSGWRMDGLHYTFPAGAMIRPGQYLVLAADRVAYAAAYGILSLVFDTFSTPLPTAGALLSLVRPGTGGSPDLAVAQVRYSPAPPWPSAADGQGGALQLIDPNQDNWRAGNWTAVTPNAYAAPRWVQVSATFASTSSTLYFYLQSAGDIYIDDVQLLDGTGQNVLADGDFESPLAGVWNLTDNFAQSSLSAQYYHSGSSSLHLVATAAGTGSGNAIYQVINPPLTFGQSYSLVFWYLQTTNGGPLEARLASSLTPVVINPAPARALLAQATPGAVNSVAQALPPFPPLWLNELQAENITGITNSAGDHAPWVELYNPSANPVSLNGLYLANNYTNLAQWPFPSDAVINAGQFLLVFADGQTNLSTPAEPHAGFTLAPGSGSLALSRFYDGMAQVLDYVDYAQVAPDDSYGSLPDGQSFAREEFYYPSPGMGNSVGGFGGPSFIAYSAPGSVYRQNFDTLPDPGPVSVNTANPVAINGMTYSLANPFDFAAQPVASGGAGGLGRPALAGWYGGSAVFSRFGAGDGDQTAGGQVSFGEPGSSNRALGLLATSSTGSTFMGARFLNTSAATLNYINLQFTGELWRQSDKAKTLTVSYYLDPTGTNTLTTNATAYLPALTTAFPSASTDAGGVAVEGAQETNQTRLGVANYPIASWPPGAALWLVWEMADATGKAQGLAIDNLSFSATAQPAAAPLPLEIALSNNGLVLSWPSSINQTYRVEYKNSLADANWTALGSVISGTGGALTATNVVTVSTQRFFRLVVGP